MDEKIKALERRLTELERIYGATLSSIRITVGDARNCAQVVDRLSRKYSLLEDRLDVTTRELKEVKFQAEVNERLILKCIAKDMRHEVQEEVKEEWYGDDDDEWSYDDDE